MIEGNGIGKSDLPIPQSLQASKSRTIGMTLVP